MTEILDHPRVRPGIRGAMEDDGLPVYDASKNPPFDEDEFNRVMDEMRKEREYKEK